jgi:hypothetical protein
MLVAAGAAILALVPLVGTKRSAQALPMFARKYNVSCATCHTSPPRLNETGYRFRAAGFRMPEEIGRSDDTKRFDPLDYNSIRIQARVDANRTRAGQIVTTSHATRLQALELYPFTGAWGGYFSTNFKVTFAPARQPAIENAHVKLNAGNERRFLGVRLGIFHPFDGYGASDSPATISRPLLQTTPANFNQTTFFTTWGFDQTGAEVGFDYRRTSIRAALLNGLVLSRTGSGFVASAAQGGPLTRPSAGPKHDGADFQLFINHTLHPEGGGVSFHYYHGNLSLPVAQTNDFFRNQFDRAAIYGSYPVVKRLHLFAGYQHGRDRTFASGRFTSRGAFAEASVPVTDLTAAGVRFDWFDPASDRPANEIRGVTTYVNAWFFEQVRIVAEYQRRTTRRGADPRRTDDAFQIRFIYIK